MSLGLWLLVVGVCDLMRAVRDTTSMRLRVLLALAGVSALVFCGVAADFTWRWWGTVGLAWVVGVAAWVLTSSAALDPGSGPVARRRWRAAAFASFLVPVGLLVLVGSRPLPATGVLSWLTESTLVGAVGATTFTLYVGVALLQLSTGNVLVRLLLDAVGVPAVTNEKRLKGGRLLGPMERLFILVLTTAGEIAAGGVVVAAKGLLRFPELQRTSKEEGPTDVSEYFLIGSFASWLLALGGWLVVQLVT